MARKPESQFASGSDERKPYHPRSAKYEAVKFLANQCRRWLAEKEPDKAIYDGIEMWENAMCGVCSHCQEPLSEDVHGICK